MTIDALLAQLDRVHRTSGGWTARCPAHDDRSPSLSIRESNGLLLLHCFAGCSLKSVCDALGIQVADLFENSPRHRPLPSLRISPTVPLNDVAGELKLHSDLLYLRAQDVLLTAQGLDVSNWTDEDWDAATDAITSAYRDLERSTMLADMAFDCRSRWLATRGKRTRI
jgi:hypothetical protein